MSSKYPCLCTVTIMRQGQVMHARRHEWRCPSCGPDKRKTIAAMAESADARRILTLTYTQPRATDSLGLPHIPHRFVGCDITTHMRRASTDGTWRWITNPECANCLRRVSWQLVQFRKRLRRLCPGVQMLRVYERHKNGALHVHILVSGLPKQITRHSGLGTAIKGAWREVGGGFVDLGYPNNAVDGSRKAGGYAAKYLTKAASEGVARGFRVWSRTAGFGPDVRMVAKRDLAAENVREGFSWTVVGWFDPYTGETTQHRPALRAAEPAPT